jgi:hypothetical protein
MDWHGEAGMTTCSRCPRQPAASLGTEWLCAEHYEAVMAPIRAAVAQRHPFLGFGVDAGGGIVECSTCGATWRGRIGAPCAWCERRGERLLEEQAEMVLRQPDSDSHDEHHRDRMSAWVQRLRRAVEAGLITEQQANRAVERASSDAA